MIDGRLTRLLCLLAVATAAGCFGIHLPQRGFEGETSFSYEVELVEDAVLVREDISPVWQSGRFGWQPGQDQLLVVTRITAWDPEAETREAAGDEAETGGETQHHVPRIWERLWITIPYGVRPGQILDLRKMDRAFLLGYDERTVDAETFTVQPAVIDGKMRIIESNEQMTQLRIDMSVRPQKRDNWKFTRTLTLRPQRENLTFARRVAPEEPLLFVARSQTFEGLYDATAVGPGGETPIGPVMPAPSPDAQAAASDDAPAPATPLPPDAADEVDEAGGEADATPEATAAAESGRTIVGKWQHASARETRRIQFTEDQRFALAVERPNRRPAIMKGIFTARNRFLVLRVNSYTLDGMDRMDELQGNPYMTFEVEWDGAALLLEGNFRDRTGGRRMVFERADFEPMLEPQPEKTADADETPEGAADESEAAANAEELDAGADSPGRSDGAGRRIYDDPLDSM